MLTPSLCVFVDFRGVQRSIAFLIIFDPIGQYKSRINLLSHICEQKAKNCMFTIRELPSYTVALSFLSLMFAYFHNQSPLLTKFEGRKKVVRDKNINGNILLSLIKPKSRTHDSRNRSLVSEIGRGRF